MLNVTSTGQAITPELDIDGIQVDEENELDDSFWEGDDDDHGGILESAREVASSHLMDIEHTDGVDVSVPQLRDYLSDAPTSATPLVSVEEQPVVSKKAAAVSGPKIFQVVTDIQF